MARTGAGIVLLFIAVAGALWMRARAAAPVRALPARVALLPVSVGQDDRDSQLLAFSVCDSLAHTLSRVPEIALQPPEYGREVSLESPSLAEFGKRSGVQFVLSGGLRRSVGGQKAQLVMTLHEVLPSGGVRETPLGRYDVPYLSSSTDVRSFVAVRDAIERNLLEELLPAVRLPRPGTAPAHPDAYRLYLLGKSRLGEATCEGEAALSLLAESLALDPGFAPAWEAYGWAEYGLASSCASDAAHYAKALDAADRALELEPKWPRAVGLKTAVLAETGRAEDAWDLLREELGRAPASSDLKAQAVYVLGYAGALEEAERRLGELIQADPNYLTEYGWTPNPYLYRGDIDRFLRHLPATDTPLFRYYRGLAEISRGRKDAAREAVEPAFRLNPGDVFARLSQALLAIIENDPAGARAVLDELAAHRRLVGSSDGEMTYKIGQLYVMAGDHEAGLAQLATAVRQGFFCAACLANDPLLRPVSGSLRYREIVRAATARHQQFRKRFAL